MDRTTHAFGRPSRRERRYLVWTSSILAAELAAQCGWMAPAHALPPNAEHVKIMRVHVKETLGRSLTITVGEEIAQACVTLERKGGLPERDRKRAKTNTGFGVRGT